MTREEILQEAASNPQYKDVHEFLTNGSINSSLAMDYILKMGPATVFALWDFFEQVRKKYMTVPGSGPSTDQNQIRKAKIYLLIAAGFVDGDLSEEEDLAIRQIANSHEFRIPDVSYKAIINEFKLPSAFDTLKDTNYGERLRLIQAADYVFKIDGTLKIEERSFMRTLFSQLGVKPADITEFEPEEYGIWSENVGSQPERVVREERPVARSKSDIPGFTPSQTPPKRTETPTQPSRQSASYPKAAPRPSPSQQGSSPSVQQRATSASPASTQPQQAAPPTPSSSSKGGSGCGWLVFLGLLLLGGLAWYFFGNNKLKYDSTDVFGYVDLGLSVKWANMNVGAARPEDSGTYYAWGETTPKSEYSWDTYKWCEGYDGSVQNRHLTKYNPDSGYGKVDGKSTLEIGDDAAHQTLSGKWRMPTKAEFQELVDNCKWKWGKVDGVYGYLVTSKIPGRTKNSIFLPATGIRYGSESLNAGESSCYWSSTEDESEPNRAYYLDIAKKSHGADAFYRFYGYPIRAVWDDSLDESATQAAPVQSDSTQEEEIEDGLGDDPDEYFDPICIESSEAGTLGNLLSGWSPDEVTELVVSGVLDARDFNTMKSTYKNLSYLDMSDARIAAYHGDGGTDANTSDYKENELPLGAFFYWVPVDEGMPSLTEVHLPKSITAIGRNAFARAYNITMIEIPEGVRSIGYVSFAICTSLQNVDLPTTLTSIGKQAFSSDKNILRVNCHAIDPPALEEGVFNCPKAELHVPEGYEEVYAESEWGKYFSYIKDDL